MTTFLRAWLVLCALAVPVAQAEIVVEDDAGQTLTFPKPVDRIVTLAPHLAETVFDVGAGERLVGTVEWSDHPAAAKRIPRVGDSYRIDVERVIAMRPDIVLAWGGGTPPTTIDRLRALDVRVAVLTPRDLASIPRHLEWLGRVTGNERVAEKKARTFEGTLERLRDEYRGHESLRVFFQIQSQPLFTIGEGHTISELIETCGGENIFSDLDSRAHSVSREAVVMRNPQAVIAGRYAGSGEELSGWLRWENMAATKHGNLFSIDAERIARPTLGILEGGRELCETLERARGNLGAKKQR